jgi:hypothetical protein
MTAGIWKKLLAVMAWHDTFVTLSPVILGLDPRIRLLSSVQSNFGKR